MARDYQVEYGKKIDPRTIANDIADMRKELGAPIHYDSEKQGYIYTDPSFRENIFSGDAADIPLSALGMGGIGALGLDREILPLIPSSVFISDWHRGLLRTVAEKVSTAGRSGGRGLGKVTVVQRKETPSFPETDAGNTVLEALEHDRELSIVYADLNGADRKYRFRPCHLVYLKGEDTADLSCFVLGEIILGGDTPYALLNAAGIKKAGLLEGTFRAARAIHVHQTDDRGIEFLLVNEGNDTLLIFTRDGPDDGTRGAEFSLLSRMDIYAGRRNLPPR